jgi:ribosomal protein S18 acetylase RimI-like enzyme
MLGGWPQRSIREVGSIIGTFNGWRGNIYRLVVHPRCRRQAIAQKLVGEVEKRLSCQGTKRITALVEKDHPGLWTSGRRWATGSIIASSGMYEKFDDPGNRLSFRLGGGAGRDKANCRMASCGP